MHKRLYVWVGAVAIIACGVPFTVPGSRTMLLGLLRSEPFEYYQPLSHWAGALKDADPEKRQEAAFVLGRIGPNAGPAVPALAEALQDESPRVRSNAALALFKIGSAARDAVPALILALKDDVALVRMDAALALSRIGPDARGAVPALLEAMQQDKNRQPMPPFPVSVRGQAVIALGKIGPDARDAIPALREALDDHDETTRDMAARALAHIDPGAAPAAEAP
jgi:HEAT repeat protein